MPRWLKQVPEWWQVLTALGLVLSAMATGSFATAKWLGWQEWGPTERLAAIETRDSLQDARFAATRDSLRREDAAYRDSVSEQLRDLQSALSTMREVQEASLRLQCAQSPELYQRLARVKC